MCVLLSLLVVIMYVEDVTGQNYCKLDLSNPQTQFCFDPRSIDGLRRCNTYEPADVIVRPGCSVGSRNSNISLSPMRCVDGDWEDIGTCNSVSAADGASCTWKGVSGRCVNIYRCLSAIDNILKNDPPPVCEDQDTEPKICCTDCSLVNDTRQILLDKRIGMLQKTGRKAHDKCLEYINELDYPCSTNRKTNIEWTLDNKKNCYNTVEQKMVWNVGPPGVLSYEENEFPHLAYLGYGSDVRSLEWLCGGSLISHNFILTAGRCVKSIIITDPPTYVALGVIKWSDPPQHWQRFKVKSTILHPDYKLSDLYNDIALLETDTQVILKGVRPACLHIDGDSGDKAEAIAFTKYLPSNVYASQVKQEKFTDEECKLFYPVTRKLRNGYNSTIQMCYGDRMGLQSTCASDSGGPLQSKEHYPEHCVFTILGVISFGRSCKYGMAAHTMFTRVQHYVPWIESVVWP